LIKALLDRPHCVASFACNERGVYGLRHANLRTFGLDITQAERAGVKQFAFISPAGVDEGHDFVPLLEAKHPFEESLKRSAIKWLIFRAGGFFSDLSEMGKTAAKGRMVVFGRGDNRFTPVYGGDLAQLMADDSQTRENAGT
jgi:uncharacterized protein YbjT (DUF2867 family)